jgi:PAS domain S-box-containing protein
MRYGRVNDIPASTRDAASNGEVHRAILESIDQGFCTIEVAFDENQHPVDYLFLEVSPSFEAQTGIKDAAGRWMREIASDQDQFWFDIYGRVALTGKPERFENFSTPLNRWWSVYACKIEGPARVAVLFHEITERKRLDEEIANSRQQFETLLNQAPLGVYLVDSDFVIREVNPVARPVFGDIPGGAVGRDFDEIIHILWDKEYADEVVRIFRHTLDTGEPYATPERAEYRVDRDIVEYYEWRLDRIVLPGGHYGVVCYFRDISPQVNARKEVEKARELAVESERHKGLLLAELQHRVRNILTVVRSIARRTAENCEDVGDYVRHLDGRLASLARVQTILTREPGQPADLHAIVLDELKSQAAPTNLYRIDGPKLELSPKATEVLSLAVHELTTNSTKYGVLAESHGKIVIRWTVAKRELQPWLSLTWHEPVDANSERPRRTGFGTDLIVNRVPYELRGTGHLLVANKWVEAKIEFPLVAEPARREVAEAGQ